MRRLSSLFLCACLLAGCESRPSPVDSSSSDPKPSPIVYGELQQPNGEITALAEIAASPELYEGKEVRTKGQIERVCQRRGCWLELSDSTGARAFVPMAGHAFTVPKESIGEQALIEGTVHRRQRSEAERNHLESDGAGSEIPTISIEAIGVLIE